MDALKFIEERNRMCDYYRGGNALSGCAECPAFQMTCVSVRSVTAEYIAAVGQWSKEHPRKTRQDVFLEQYPEAELTLFTSVVLYEFLAAAYDVVSGWVQNLKWKWRCAGRKEE